MKRRNIKRAERAARFAERVRTLPTVDGSDPSATEDRLRGMRHLGRTAGGRHE